MLWEATVLWPLVGFAFVRVRLSAMRLAATYPFFPATVAPLAVMLQLLAAHQAPESLETFESPVRLRALSVLPPARSPSQAAADFSALVAT